jgi:putative DNA primase/helicase
MRRRGASEAAILAALREENARRCRPPLADHQVAKIARSVARYAPAIADEALDDIGNARRLVRLHGDDLRYVTAWRCWLAWDGRRWQRDATREAEWWAEDVVRDLYAAAARAASDDERKRFGEHAKRTANQRKRSDLLETAKHQREIVVTPDLLDADAWLLNVENGTLDLRTGKLRAHRREDLLTKLAPVTFDPTARAPRWRRFLREITGGDAELTGFLQRAVGYTLTGSTREECLFFCYGTGQNGKTTFLETLRAALGDYAVQVPFDALLNRSGDGAQERYMAIMPNARFVTAIEASKGRPFNEALVKWLTSSDKQVARRLYENPFEFAPTHKLWLGANHQPPVRDQSLAFWRRMRLIPFTVTIPPSRRDKDLRETLRAELSGVLSWALAGCASWQATNDLAAPKAVLRATRGYRTENDQLGEFIEARCDVGPDTWVATADLYQSFAAWWSEMNGPRAYPPRRDAFVVSLKERRSLRAKKRGGVRGWAGIALKDGPQRSSTPIVRIVRDRKRA